MRKSTLIKGGSSALLCAMAFYGLSPLLTAAETTESTVKAKWYNIATAESWENEVPLVNAYDFNPVAKVNVHDHWKANSTAQGNYESKIDFSQMGAGLLDGVFVTFMNLEEGTPNYQKMTGGEYVERSYAEIANHEPMNNAKYMKFTDESGNVGLGIYQNRSAGSRIDFVYSTKGLSNVESVELSARSYGNQNYVNRTIDWTYDVYVYNLDGSLVGQMVKDRELFTSSNDAIGALNPALLKAHVSDANNEGVWPQNSLDNKLIVVMLKGDRSEDDPASTSTTNETEPLTVFSNLRLAFERPEVTFGAVNNKLFEAGAGRNTSGAPDTLVTNVSFWNTLYANDIISNEYTETFEGENRGNLYNLDNQAGKKQQLAYYELNVDYPFIADKMEISDEFDLTKVHPGVADNKGWFSLSEMDGVKIVGVPGVDKTVTYYIPREYFVQVNANDRDLKSTARFTYYFAPQEVKKFDKANYIWSTITAEASDTARYELQGSSIPEYKELNTLHFDEYLDYQTAEVSFKNLPYFNSFNNKRPMNPDHYGALMLVNETKAPGDATDRYDDDVNIKGWKVVFINEDNKKDSTYVWSRYLDIQVHGNSYTDYISWLKENGCPTCGIYDTPEVGSDMPVMKVIDESGNFEKNIVSIHAIFKYHRGDINIGDDESKYVNETYKINPALTYNAKKARFNVYTYPFYTENTLSGTTYTYTGQNLMDKVGGAVYEGPIKILGNNTFVWFHDTDQSLLSHAMGVFNSEFLKYFEKIDNKDFFMAPFDEFDSYTYESRPHTVKVFATGLKPDVEGGKTASIKIFKEKFSKKEGTNDDVYHTNAFLFSAESLDFAKVYVKQGSREFPVEEYNGAANGKFIGMSMGDTLVYKVDLDNEYAVQYVEENGLDLIVKYVPKNDINGVKWLKDNWEDLRWFSSCIEEIILPNVFSHVAQFGATASNDKGFNEFYTFGATDRGLMTTMNADKVIGSYTSFYSFLTQQFGSCTTCSSLEEWVPAPNLIYNEMFRKDYKTRYVNTCYPVQNGQFVIAGLNITDPVDMEVFTNKEGAFDYEVTVLGDLNGEAYGKVDTVGNMVQISPNQYGEVLALITTKFDPTDRDGLEMTVDTITSGTERGMWARYYAKDSIRLAPQQYTADVEKNNRIYFYDLDDYSVKPIGKDLWEEYGIWAPYGINVSDTLTAVIKGDVKVPEVWFSSDAEGKEVINAFDFGMVNAGTIGDSVIYIQGRDLPHYGTTVNDTDPKVEQEINLLSGETNLFTFGNNAKEVKLFIREKSMELAAVAEDQPYVFKGGEKDLVNGVLRGDVAAKIELHATPNVEDLCNNTDKISLTAVCDVQQDLSLAFTPGLLEPTIKEMEPGDVGGSDARIKWTATPGAQYYQVAVGRFTPKFTSEDVFISEVRADDASKNIWVELFNATGDVIHPELQVNYWLQVIKEYTDEKGVAHKDTIVKDIDNALLQGNTEPIYQSKWGYKPIVCPLSNMELTEPGGKTIKYTIRLMEGFNTDAHQIDIYLFDTPATWMVRKPVNGMPINEGNFNTGEWRTEVGSLPNPYYEWQDDINFDGKESFRVSPTSTSIAVHNLLPQTAYTARVRAFNECVGGEEMIPSEAFYDFATSKNPTSSGEITFDEAEEHNPVSNESINTTAVRVVGGEGKVTILNAAGKTVTVSNVLGQTVATTVLSSDYETIDAPAGIVVVVIESETAVKAIVK